jgi:hypothetical protein
MGDAKSVTTFRLEQKALKRLDRMIEKVRKNTGFNYTRSESLRYLILDLLDGGIKATARTSRFVREAIDIASN